MTGNSDQQNIHNLEDSSSERESSGAPSDARVKSKKVKNNLLDVLKSSGGAKIPQTLAEEYSFEVSAPNLVPPASQTFTSSDVSGTSIDEIINKPSFSYLYDRLFFIKKDEYGKEMAEKGKFIQETQQTNFTQQILFAYTHPGHRGLCRAAKKFAYQASNRSFRDVSAMSQDGLSQEEAEKLADTHRMALKAIIDEVASRSYVATFERLSEELSANDRAALNNALHNPTVRSYLSEELKNHFYTIEKKAASWTRENFGAPEHYEFRPNRERYESQNLLTREALYHAELSKLQLSDQVNHVLESVFYRPELLVKYPKAAEAFVKVSQALEKNILEREFGSDSKKRLHHLQDHLFFQKMYIDSLDIYQPPLTSEQKSLLTRFSSSGGHNVPESLKISYEIAYREAKTETVNTFNLQTNWEPDAITLADALKLIRYAKLAAKKLKTAPNIAVQALQSIVDRKNHTTDANSEEFKVAYQAITDMALSDLQTSHNAKLRVLRDAADHAMLIGELEKELGSLSADEIREMLKGGKAVKDIEKGQIEQAYKAAIAKVKDIRGLSPDWKVNIAMIQSIAENRTVLTSLKQRYSDYFDVYFKIAQDLCKALSEDHPQSNQLLKTEFKNIASHAKQSRESLYREMVIACENIDTSALQSLKDLWDQNRKALKDLEERHQKVMSSEISSYETIFKTLFSLQNGILNPYDIVNAIPLTMKENVNDTLAKSIQNMMKNHIPEGVSDTMTVEHAIATSFILSPEASLANANTLIDSLFDNEAAISAFATKITVAAAILLTKGVTITLISGAFGEVSPSSSLKTPSDTKQILREIASAIKQSSGTLASGLKTIYQLDQDTFSATKKNLDRALTDVESLFSISKFEADSIKQLKQFFATILSRWNEIFIFESGASVLTQCLSEMLMQVRQHELKTTKSLSSKESVANLYGAEKLMATAIDYLSENIAQLTTEIFVIDPFSNRQNETSKRTPKREKNHNKAVFADIK